MMYRLAKRWLKPTKMDRLSVITKTLEKIMMTFGYN